MLTHNSYMEKLNSFFLHSTCKLINSHALYSALSFYFIVLYSRQGLILSLASESQAYCFVLPNAGITGMCHDTQLWRDFALSPNCQDFFQNYSLFHIL